ncbi:helix-turn-helix transcriptional regulator [Actinokineospora bangkokensis]|uniref:HTH luxR-type domain-containing protein n=1 Tax=Actinokineospora bangkokensis TaxID=1193682 RepID=A0A1Q9LLJ8_9PSEU|nr:LuxR C-terminal-related transcriptional regulator [Actinokineospora bangkokensis]OLR92873.1 hypothetical protein BJP25_19300 [Actinokineospora bangkokensis]
MGGRIPVHVHAPDAITRFGLNAALGQCAELVPVEWERVAEGTVVLLAADAVDAQLLRAVRELHARGCTHLILVTSAVDEAGLRAAVEVGICGVVQRDEVSPSKLSQTVVKATQGEAAMPAQMLTMLLNQVSRLQHGVSTARSTRLTGLTARETQVLRLVADGLDTDEIATELSYSSRTVKNILYGVTSRFCLRNRSHAVAYAMREGFI